MSITEETTSVVDQAYANAEASLAELSDEDLIQTVTEVQLEMKHMELENQIFENFLLASEPSLIVGMERILQSALKMQRNAPVYFGSTTSQLRMEPSRQTLNYSESTSDQTSYKKTSLSGQSHAPEKGPRINLSQKTDLVLREIEEMQLSLERFIERSHRIKCKLKAEIEESAIREVEVKEARDLFEQSIVIGAVEKLTQKIPAEKFVRYMQEWLKSAQFTLEKLRLRTSSLKIQQQKLKTLLTQKEELGECVHEVDFEKLRIENKHLLEKIDQKNNHLLELKRMNGKANLMHTNHKKILQQQTEELNLIKKSVEDSRKRIHELEMEAEEAEAEVEVERSKYEELKEKVKHYKVPEVMEYIQKKAELSDLKKALKIWNRKVDIQKIALNTYTRKMMQITGINKPRSSWFDLERTSEDMTSYELDSKSSETDTSNQQDEEL